MKRYIAVLLLWGKEIDVEASNTEDAKKKMAEKYIFDDPFMTREDEIENYEYYADSNGWTEELARKCANSIYIVESSHLTDIKIGKYVENNVIPDILSYREKNRIEEEREEYERLKKKFENEEI